MARLRLSRLALAAALACAAGRAAADPITLVATLAPIIGGSAAAFLISNAAYFALAGYALYSNVSAKRKAAAQAAAARSQYNANLQDRNVSVLSGEAPWQVVYGNPAPIGGSIVGIFSSGSRDQYKHLVIVYAAHTCQAIDEIYIDGDPVGALDGNGDCTAGTFFEQRSDATTTEIVAFDGAGVGTVSHPVVTLLGVTQTVFGGGGSESDGATSQDVTVPATASANTITAPLAAGLSLPVSYTYATSIARINVQKHLSPGGVDTADAYLIARCPEWTAADKLSGYTYAVITLDLDLARFQGGPPNITVKLRGKPVYDWRTGLAAYSANPALCLADFLLSEAGFGATLSQIDTAQAIAAANACDAAGLRCDGAFTTAEARETTKQNLEDAFGGTAHQSGGVWRILPGAWTSPVMTLSEADLAAPIQITQASYPSNQRFNTVRGTYIDGAGLGVATDFTPWSNSTEVAADGTTRVRDVAFAFTRDHQRCQDLARMIAERSRGGLTITIPGLVRLWPLQPGDRIAVNNAEYGWSAKTFRATDWGSHPAAPVTVTAVEDVAAYYDAAAVIAADAAPNTNLPDPFSVQVVGMLTAASGTDQLLLQGDGTLITRVLVSWATSSNPFVRQGGQLQLQYRPASDTTGSWQSAPPVNGADSSAYLMGLQDGVTYLLRARYVNQLGIPGPWSVLSHRVIGKTEPPPDVSAFTIDGDRLSWPGVVALDLAGYQIRFAYGNNTYWASATPVHEGLITNSPYTLGTKPVGVVTLLIKAVDTSGNESTNAASIVTNLGDPDINNILLSYPEAPTFAGTIANGAVSAGVLQASGLDRFYGDDTQPFYGADGTLRYPAGTYAQLQYTWSRVLPYAGTVLLEHTVVAADFGIEYQRDSQEARYGADADPVYGADADPFYGPPGAWQVWPGSIELTAAETLAWRITAASGATQGQVSVATVILDVPDIVEEMQDVVISAGGTRLPITRSYRSIQNVLITLQTDGNGGRSVTTEDKNTALGPLITVRNAAGTAVVGLVDARIKGY